MIRKETAWRCTPTNKIQVMACNEYLSSEVEEWLQPGIAFVESMPEKPRKAK